MRVYQITERDYEDFKTSPVWAAIKDYLEDMKQVAAETLANPQSEETQTIEGVRGLQAAIAICDTIIAAPEICYAEAQIPPDEEAIKYARED
jgi:hypothetical protein